MILKLVRGLIVELVTSKDETIKALTEENRELKQRIATLEAEKEGVTKGIDDLREEFNPTPTADELINAVDEMEGVSNPQSVDNAIAQTVDETVPTPPEAVSDAVDAMLGAIVDEATSGNSADSSADGATAGSAESESSEQVLEDL